MNVILYGKNACSYTKAAKEAFKALCIPIRYIPLDDKISGKQIGHYTNTTSETVPVIIIDGKWIGGFSELQKILKKSWNRCNNQCEHQQRPFSTYEGSY